MIATSLLAGAATVTAAATAGAARPGNRETAPANGARAKPAVPGGSDLADSIPDAALLQPEDLRGAATSSVDNDRWAALRPPRPGAESLYPSSSLLHRERTVSALVGMDEAPGVFVEWVGTFRANGAHRYMRDLRAALAGCEGEAEVAGEWSLLATGVAGSESLLLQLRETTGTTARNIYLAVARTGRAVVMVADAGWETVAGKQVLVEDLVVPAVERARILR